MIKTDQKGGGFRYFSEEQIQADNHAMQVMHEVIKRTGERLVVLSDISGTAKKKEVNPKEASSIQFAIPVDYYARLGVSENDAIPLTQALIATGCLSARSTVAQAGGVLENGSTITDAFTDLPMERHKDQIVFNLDLVNNNSKLTFELSPGHPYFRFFIRPTFLVGDELVTAVKSLTIDPSAVKIASYNDKKVPLNQYTISDPLDPATTVDLPIKRVGYFTEEKSIRLAELKRDRVQLDKALGLTWVNYENASSARQDFGTDWVLGETADISLPPSIAAVIVRGVRRGSMNETIHSNSALIDPGFGSPQSLAIRTEDWTAGYNSMPPSDVILHLFHA